MQFAKARRQESRKRSLLSATIRSLCAHPRLHDHHTYRWVCDTAHCTTHSVRTRAHCVACSSPPPASPATACKEATSPWTSGSAHASRLPGSPSGLSSGAPWRARPRLRISAASSSWIHIPDVRSRVVHVKVSCASQRRWRLPLIGSSSAHLPTSCATARMGGSAAVEYDPWQNRSGIS